MYDYIRNSMCSKCYTVDCTVKLNLTEEPIHIHCLQYTSKPRISLTLEEIDYINILLNNDIKTNNSWYEKLKGWQQSEADEFKKRNEFIQGIIDKLKQ